MITITFEPTCPEQAALLGEFLPKYMRAGELVVAGEPEDVKAVVEQAAQVVEEKAPRRTRKPREEAAAAPVEKPADTPPVTEQAQTEAAAPAPAPASPSEPAGEPVTLEMVRARLTQLSQAGKAPAVKDLIAQFGAAKLTEIPQDKYAALLAAAKEIS